MTRLALVVAVTAAVVLGAAGAATGGGLRLARVAAGFDGPVHVAAPQSQPGVLYVVEQPGRIVRLVLGTGRRTVFLDLTDRVSCCGERGLLSVAFHPGYASNHRLYVDFTNESGDTEVVEFRARGGVARRSSARLVLRVDQPFPNHNGGQLAFGPDGKLYVGMGDGGSGGDPADHAQNLGSRLGKILRVDVDSSPARIRIAAYGVRNPWRFSFDRASGDFYAGDVGQGAFEEIDYVEGVLPRLVNFGWDVFEGNAAYEDKQPSGSAPVVFPIAVYDHGRGCSVTGGFVYRGARVPGAIGRYFYGDYCSGTVWSLRVEGGKARGVRREPFRVDALTSFGEDARGELYLVSHDGTLYRLAG